ncbi:MAG: radical SAM protein [Coriobacteriales bacterium]|jgi:elongator complex protein 3|nr:radical SAM protein [Coriobacteriales bacterium]
MMKKDATPPPHLEDLILAVLARLRHPGQGLDERALNKLIRAFNRRLAPGDKQFAKRQLLPFYFRVKEGQPERWQAWQVDADLEGRLLRSLQMKPGRTATGVATISVLTKPWSCSGDCLFCPNDLRMPKSYLHKEPACQRAERNYFDPYLQVVSRLRALTQMGHRCEQVELIVLGGSWTDYPGAYQRWFVTGLMRALNDADDPAHLDQQASLRRRRYQDAGIANQEDALADFTAPAQALVDAGEINFNHAVRELYGQDPGWRKVALAQEGSWAELEAEQARNRQAKHHLQALALETRPDAIDLQNLADFERFGCTRVQIGLQSLDPGLLQLSGRPATLAQMRQAVGLLRRRGFRVHAHLMLNLPGATPESDKAEYRRLMEEPGLRPDELKLYPCVLVAGTGLERLYRDGRWRPYSDAELLDVLVSDLLATPSTVRISRMVRDISASDIMAGNKRANLRQLVEQEAERRIAADGGRILEQRYRERHNL